MYVERFLQRTIPTTIAPFSKSHILPVSRIGIRFLKTKPSTRNSSADKTNSSTRKTPANKTGDVIPPTAPPFVYKPPALGVNPAYDEALKYIAEDKAKKYQEIEEIEQIIKMKINQGVHPNDESIKEFEKEIYDLAVYAEANDPEIRWNFEHGKIDMTKPIYRFLREKQWKNGYNQHLMERINQMFVVPDVFPLVKNLTIDLQFKFESDIVEPGIFLKPINTIDPPTMIMTNYHVDTRLYTLFMVDPDMPDVTQKTFKTEWHWLVINIPLMATKNDMSGGETLLPYVPPHPPKGTKYHRYTFGVYEQTQGKIEKEDLDLSIEHPQLVEQYQLKLCGTSFFREIWDETVSDIYRDILKIREPIYAKPPKEDPYLEVATGKKRSAKYLETLNDQLFVKDKFDDNSV
ncbi:922_t:CDS:2 [Diversispora eburnea]|uniref:922_t:CDS:1 n=1 Tax=Diversispora eburnea TaxID=1213867 RepID=A0A9N8W7R9_9GLOM|nr:922_t:CDS:2 [Diversispora eburnea]